MIHAKRTYYANQVEIIHLPISNVCTQIGWIFHSGMQDECQNQYGISHLVEHLLCDNLQKTVDANNLSHPCKVNAFTTSSLTYYYISAKNCEVGNLLENIELDWILGNISKEALENEKIKVIQEVEDAFKIDRGKVSLSMVFDQWNQNHYLGFKNITHLDSLINAITPEEITDFIKSHYQLNNMTLLLIGPKIVEQISKKTKTHLDKITDKKLSNHNFFLELNKNINPNKHFPFNENMHYSIEKNTFYLSFRIKNTDPNKYKILLLILNYYNNSNAIKFPIWGSKGKVSCFSTGYTDHNFIIIKGELDPIDDLMDNKEAIKNDLYNCIFDSQYHAKKILSHFLSKKKENKNKLTVSDVVYWVNHNRISGKKKRTAKENFSLEKNEWEDIEIPSDISRNVTIEDIKYVYEYFFCFENAKFLLLP